MTSLGKVAVSILRILLFYILQVLFYMVSIVFLIAYFYILKSSNLEESIVDTMGLINGNNTLMYIFSSITGIVLFLMIFNKRCRELYTQICRNKIPVKRIICLIGIGTSTSVITNILCNMLHSGVEQAVGKGNIYQEILYFVGTVIVVVIVEEILYRGFLLGELVTTVSIPCAVVVSSLIFAIMHGNVTQGIYTFVLGCLLALFYIGGNNLLCAVIVHFFFNLTAVIITHVEKISMTTAVVLIILSIGIFILCICRANIFSRNERGSIR